MTIAEVEAPSVLLLPYQTVERVLLPAAGAIRASACWTALVPSNGEPVTLRRTSAEVCSSDVPLGSPCVRVRTSWTSMPGMPRLLYGRGSCVLIGGPIWETGPTVTVAGGMNSGPRQTVPGGFWTGTSETSGCSKSGTSVALAITAGNELTWLRWTRQPLCHPAVRLSPRATYWSNFCAAAGLDARSASPRTRDAGRRMRCFMALLLA